MDADVCLWHKADIELRHIKRLLTGAERTSHKHPFKQCEAAVRQESHRTTPGVTCVTSFTRKSNVIRPLVNRP